MRRIPANDRMSLALTFLALAPAAATSQVADGVEVRFELRSASARAVSPAAQGAFPIQLILDDGQQEGTVGIADDAGARQFLWFNRFDMPAEELELREIWVLFPSGPNMDVGQSVELVVYHDADSDPTNGADLITSFDSTIQAVDDVTFSIYPVPAPQILSGAGDVLIGVVNRFVQSGVTPSTEPAALDQTASQGRSWVGVWSGDPPDPPSLPPDDLITLVDDLGPGLGGNWMIRGFGNPAAADLMILKEAAVSGDDAVDFTITVTNDGPGDATGVVVTDPLPECTSYVADTCGAGAGDPFIWTIGNLAAEGSASCDVTVDASGCDGEGEQTNTATVAGKQEDPNPDNDTAEATFEIEPPPAPTADLSLTHEATVGAATVATSADSASPASTVTAETAEKPRAADNGDTAVVFALTVANDGPDDATGVVVTNELPECTQIVSDECGGDAGPPWTWTVGALAADASASCNLKVDAAQCSGAQTATAQVTADQDDSDPDDNTAEASFEIEAVPALPALALLLLAALLAVVATHLLRRGHAPGPPHRG